MNAQLTNTNESQGTFVEPRVFVKGDYLIHRLPGNILVRKHLNFYRAILGIPLVKSTREDAQD